LTVILDLYSKDLFGGFTFGMTTLALNAMFMIIGLFIISKPATRA